MIPRKAELTHDQERMKVETLAAFMKYCPFFCYYFYDQMEEWPTYDVPTAATDMRRLYYNPEYFANLKPLERAFAYAHEVYHAIYKHPLRMASYVEAGELNGLPFNSDLFNEACDYPINADLIDNKLGMCNPAWLYDPNIKGDELAEDVYKKLYKQQPPSRRPQPGQGQPGQGQPGPGAPGPSTYGQHNPSAARYSKPDQAAAARGGRFDVVLLPQIDPATGKPDVPSEMEFKEAIARAVDAAEKSQGNLPGGVKRLVQDILEPQISWREHVRMLTTGKIGSRGESWRRPNRRRLALSAIGGGLPVYMPGRNQYGAELVVCVADNSGSISDRELAVFFGEMNGILADCKPRRIIVIWCDAMVRRVASVRSLDELGAVKREGSEGGGGTSFVPPFTYLKEQNLKPDTLVYLTDMYGTFPEAPAYPVIWCATTDKKPPFGEVVRVKV